ncbi:hypothetical protein CHU92_01265, partial [Flavobacterium cyanobacteriorum]
IFVLKIRHYAKPQNVTSKRRTTDTTTKKRPKHGRQLRCNWTQTDQTLPTLEPNQIVLKFFPPHILKNNF